MASKNYNGTSPKYLNDLSKALAGEVRILLAEVGKLRDERRALQYEIAELMSVKSKHGAGGEYSPDWRPKAAPLPDVGGPPPPPLEDGPPAPARPAWRSVQKRPPRKEKVKETHTLPSSPSLVPPLEAPRPDLPAWAQWRPNPLLSAPTAVVATPGSPLPGPERQGLFGPPTPPPMK